MSYKKNSGKVWTSILAVVLALVFAGTAALVGVLSDGFKDWSKFRTDEQTDELSEDEQTAFNGGAIIEERESNGAAITMSVIAEEQYADYGVSQDVESAYFLSATVEPSDATDQTVDWSISFVDSSSGWASGKTVTDYVAVAPTEDGALTAVVACMQAFGEQMIITCASRSNPEVCATCTVDYAQKVDESTVSLFFGNERILQGPYILSAYYCISIGIESLNEYEQNLRGGEMKASYSTSDTYTLADEFTVTCTLSSPVTAGEQLWGGYGEPSFYYPEGSPDSFHIFNAFSGGVAENGLYFSLAWFVENLGLKWLQGGSHGYTSYGDVFDEYSGRTAAYYADLFNSLSENPPMCVIDFSINGTYSSYEKNVTVYVNTAYEYGTSVSSISLDEEQIVF